MKKIILLLLAGAVCTSSFAQRRVKYKDIYDKIGKEPTEHSFLKLSEFQKIQPEFPNTYVQSALIQWSWLKEEDPFLNYSYVNDLIYNTKLYLGLGISKIQKDDKEVKKNKVYYANVCSGANPDAIDQQLVLDELNKINKKVLEYEENVTKIISNFNTTIAKYNGCIDAFKSIVARQNNYKNLLVTNSDDLRKEMSDLAQNYDSVNYFFSEFKAALGNYPIKNYNQQTKVIPINTYRLEGLTSSNFINQEIPIWDYQKWVKEAFEIMDGNIAKLKSETEKEINSMRSRIEALQKAKAETDSIQEIVAPNTLVNLIEKYDYESLLSASLRYEAAISNLKIASMRSANNVENPASFNEDFSQKANYYYDLYLMANNSYNNLNTQTLRITDNNLTMHEVTVNKLYGGAKEFKNSYNGKQKAEIEKIQKQNFENFKLYTIDNLCPEGIKLQHNGKEISAMPSTKSFDNAEANTYVTTYTCKDNAGNRYIAGYVKTSATTANGFVAKVNSNGTIAWVKDVNAAAGGINKVVQVIPSKYVGFVAVAANKAGEANKSAVLKMDNDGKQLSKTDFTSSLYPTASFYDEINDKVMTVMKGANGNDNTESGDEAVVETVTLGQKVPAVSPAFNIKGKVTDLISTSKGFFAVCNATEVSANGATANSKSNLFTVTIYDDKVNVVPVECDNEVNAMKAFQVNAGTINITGSYNKMGSQLSKSDKPAYILVDTNGALIYKN